ncbi:LysR family transcriptional regulator [Vibrio caribbeanicus]|uniref:LysR family transcriptional regulator n=1 Tax=Vibrio caribbeanicus TaxID=701175 RepID=UPI0030D6D661
MNLTHLDTFLSVAKMNSFSSAADHLGVSKGLVSRHIKALEVELSCTLFYRNTRNVSLTEAGKELFLIAKEIEVLKLGAEKKIHDLLQEDQGVIRFTAPISLGPNLCRAVIPKFRARYPNVNLDIDFSTLIKDVEFGSMDIALRAYSELGDNLVAKDFGWMKNLVVSSPEFQSKHRIKAPSDLVGLECIGNLINSDWDQWPLFSANNEKVVVPSGGKLACSSYDGILQFALLGEGVANLPMPIAEKYLATGQLVEVLPGWYSLIHYFHLVYAYQRNYPKKLRDFIGALVDWKESHEKWFVSEPLLMPHK